MIYRFFNGEEEKFDWPGTVYLQDGFVCVSFFPPGLISEGFYGARLDYNLFKEKFVGDYYVCNAAGRCYSKKYPCSFPVPSSVLLDSDYKHDFLFGMYVLEGRYDEIGMNFYIQCFKNPTIDEVDYFSRTQSPVFNSPPFHENSQFYGLHRSSEMANGYDVVLKNFTHHIEPIGNLIIDLKDSYRFKSSGSLFLRSRFVRLGLEIHVYGNSIVHLTNHSSHRVHFPDRIFQYVPLRTFNGDVCKSSTVMTVNISTKTQAEGRLKRYLLGGINQNYKDEKASKFQS